MASGSLSTSPDRTWDAIPFPPNHYQQACAGQTLSEDVSYLIFDLIVLDLRPVVSLALDSFRVYHGKLDASCFRFHSLLWSLVLFGSFVADRDDGLVPRIAVEVVIEIFQGAVRCLRVEEVNNREEHEIEDCKD